MCPIRTVPVSTQEPPTQQHSDQYNNNNSYEATTTTTLCSNNNNSRKNHNSPSTLSGTYPTPSRRLSPLNKNFHTQISVRAIQNARISMEDEYCIRDNCFYAIFDGHGGGGVSRYLKHHLYDTISYHQQQSHNSLSNALIHAFRDIETIIENDEALKYQGSTATAIYITEHELISANIGDSRAVLSRNRKSLDLTTDHKPLIEKERIFQLGETITWDRFSKVHRVRNLSVSRAMGDVYAKPVVSSDVDIKHFARESNDEFIILATDGLWDVMESAEAVAFCHGLLDQIYTKEARLVLKRNMARHLTQEAVRRGSGDNVCVVMIWLKE